jgi:adenosylcobinamide-phosphate synthase
LASFARTFYVAAVIYFLYAALAWRSLKDETMPVAVSLFTGDLPRAREELSLVVGRDVQNLDENGIVRAALETIGENFIDGIFSVIFFSMLGYIFCGATGAVIMAWLFKAVNTMDSMVGYDDERYHDFGRACAKLDDALNFIPARIGGVILLLAGACLRYPFRQGCRVFLRDRKKHKSPNSAHGESAFAGLLGIRLGGGAEYGGVFEARPEIGDDLREPETADILRTHAILDASVALCALILLFLFGWYKT